MDMNCISFISRIISSFEHILYSGSHYHYLSLIASHLKNSQLCMMVPLFFPILLKEGNKNSILYGSTANVLRGLTHGIMLPHGSAKGHSKIWCLPDRGQGYSHHDSHKKKTHTYPHPQPLKMCLRSSHLLLQISHSYTVACL